MGLGFFLIPTDFTKCRGPRASPQNVRIQHETGALSARARGRRTRGMARSDTSSAHHGNGGLTDHRARSGRRHRQSIPRPPPCLRPDARDARHASSWRLRALQKTFTDGKRRCDTTEDAQKRSQSIAGPHGRARTPGRRLFTSMNALRSCPSMDVLRAERQEIAHCTSLSLSPVHLRTTRVCSVSSSLRVALYSQQPLPLSPAHDDAERLWPMASRHAHTRLAVLCLRACARRRWTLCTRWQRVMWHAGTPCRAASTRVNPVRHLRLLPHRHQGGRRAPWSDATRHGGRRARRGAAPRGPVCSAVHKARLMPAQALVPDWFSRSLGFGDDDHREPQSSRFS